MDNVDFFLSQNSGSPWKSFHNVFLQADFSSDASGRAFGGIVDFPNGATKVKVGEFQDNLLSEDIQVKEAEALRATINMLVLETPELIKGKLWCVK